LIKIIIISSLVLLGFVYGASVGHYHVFPYDNLSDIKNIIFKYDEIPPRLQIHQDLSKINELIDISTVKNLEDKKQSLINYIWFNNTLPSKIPESFSININDTEFENMKNLERIDSFTVKMDYGMDSTSYLFLAENSNNNLIIYHQGHDSYSPGHFDSSSFILDERIIQYFLDRQYSVLIFSMVGQGMNNEPIIDFDRFGTIQLNSHNHFELLESDSFHPIKFFIEPVISTLNLIENKYSFESYNMIGKNSGGWITTIVSSIDKRIKNSFSVGGSFPLWMSPNERNFGDYEQHIPEFLEIANHEELYIMSAYGLDRKSILIYNEFDPCCFSGHLYEKYPFKNQILSKLQNIGNGEFDVLIDIGQKNHIVSDNTLEKIIILIEE